MALTIWAADYVLAVTDDVDVVLDVGTVDGAVNVVDVVLDVGTGVVGVVGVATDVVGVLPAVVGVVVGALGLSGDVQLAGGTPEPDWPGMRTVPAHPKFEKIVESVTDPPSLKVSVEITFRMNPAPSTDITEVFATNPWVFRTPSASVRACDSALETPGAVGNLDTSLATV